MAAFYNQEDQDIYSGGDHFIPQSYYRLGNFTPTVPTTQTQQVNQGYGIPYTGAFTNSNFNRDNPNSGFGTWGDLDESSAKQFNIDGNIVTGYKNLNSGLYQDEEGYNLQNLGLFKDEEDAKYSGLFHNVSLKAMLKNPGIIKSFFNRQDVEKQAELQKEIDAANFDAMQEAELGRNIAEYGTTGGVESNRPNTGINAPGGERGQSPTGGDVEGTPFAHGGIVSRLGLAPGGPAGGASAGGDYGGNVNPEQEYAGRTFEETYRGDGPTISDDGPTKKLSISPIINTKTTDLGFTFPTGVVGFDALSPLGKIRATLNLKNYVKGEDVDPQIDYTKNIGNFNFEGTTDLDNYHLGATYNQGPFFAGATTNNMGDTNFNVGARWQWGGKDGGLVSIL